MSTLRVSTLQNAASSTANITLDASGNATVGGTLAMGSSFLRNRIINGGMDVYQRGSVAATTSGAYTLDRWFVTPTGATVTVTQSTSVVPTGFADSLNVAGAASVTNVSVRQRIESVNTQDLASGVQVTVSGWIRQSTGSAVTTATIALAAPTALDNYTSTTSAATTYTLPSIPNATWTTFSNTFTLTTSCVNGLQVTIALGTGLTTGSFNLTGVQLEVGSVATPFERRQYGTELMLCQRYYQTIFNGAAGFVDSATKVVIGVVYPVAMRSAPSGALGGTTVQVATSAGAQNAVGATIDDSTYYVGSCQVRVTGYTGLTTGQGAIMRSGNGVTFLLLSAEL